MREELVSMMQSIDSNAHIIHLSVGYKCLFNAVVCPSHIAKITKFCAKYDCNWGIGALDGRLCVQFIYNN